MFFYQMLFASLRLAKKTGDPASKERTVTELRKQIKEQQRDPRRQAREDAKAAASRSDKWDDCHDYTAEEAVTTENYTDEEWAEWRKETKGVQSSLRAFSPAELKRVALTQLEYALRL